MGRGLFYFNFLLVYQNKKYRNAKKNGTNRKIDEEKEKV